MQEKGISEYLSQLNDFAKKSGLDIHVYQNTENQFMVEARNPKAVITREKYIHISVETPDGKNDGYIEIHEENNKVLFFLHSKQPVGQSYGKFFAIKGKMNVEKTYGLWNIPQLRVVFTINEKQDDSSQ